MKIRKIGCLVLLGILMTSCQNKIEVDLIQTNKTGEKSDGEGINDDMNVEIVAEIKDQIFDVIIYDNRAANEFLVKLPLSIEMNDMNGNEKYYYLDERLTEEAVLPKKVNKGDLMLFGSECLVLFYETFNTTYSYTPLGFIENTDKLAEVLGNGSVVITFRQR